MRAADGEVGDANPVYAIGVVLRRNAPGSFTGIVLSTPPSGASTSTCPAGFRKEYPLVHLVHLVAEPSHAGT